jgi:hypothetical protein
MNLSYGNKSFCVKRKMQTLCILRPQRVAQMPRRPALGSLARAAVSGRAYQVLNTMAESLLMILRQCPSIDAG